MVEITKNWTESENFDIYYCGTIDKCCQYFTSERETGH